MGMKCLNIFKIFASKPCCLRYNYTICNDFSFKTATRKRHLKSLSPVPHSCKELHIVLSINL